MALILTRKPGERLMIGDEIAVTVKEIGRGRVRLFVEAPREVVILRGEIVDRIEEGDVERTVRPAG